MNKLTVLYDAGCGFCVKCRWWLEMQPKLLPLEMMPAGGPDARARFPELDAPGFKDELVAIDDQGGVYRGTDAWLMCLWALEDYREWAERLASPALRPLARGAFAVLSAGRKKMSKWFAMAPEEEIAATLARAEPPRCEG
ncbi:MAG TPA: DCC1-like thiol-disulfide oxidoreductase family protein [Planctomycetota bacterium]|nr:DCC1-like thiol-disulfide oxidoreductase family protein [Planctomycetota bacterium]